LRKTINRKIQEIGNPAWPGGNFLRVECEVFIAEDDGVVRLDIDLMVKDYGLNGKVQRRRTKRRPLEPLVS